MSKKKEIRLKPAEAEYLGFKIKTITSEGNPKYRLTPKQQVKLKEFREDNSLVLKGRSVLENMQTGQETLRWNKYDVDANHRLEMMRLAVEVIKDNSPAIPVRPLNVRVRNSDLVNQYTITDFHLGMMAWHEETGDDWDIDIAEKVIMGYFQYTMDTAPNAATAIFAQIGDFLHWDGIDAVTPASKHVLDADTRFSKLVALSIRVQTSVIAMLLDKYEHVHIIQAEGNHDEATSIHTRQWMAHLYRDEPRITVDVSPSPYYMYEFGETLLFYHHGHKRRPTNITKVLVAMFKEEFGRSKNVYCHMGHLHHKHVKEDELMIVEQHRTLAAKDAYASRGGWLSGRDSVLITYHKKYGEMDRKTVNINVIMDALGEKQV